MKPTKRLNNLWIILITFIAVSCSSKDDTSEVPTDSDSNQSTDTAENAPDFSLTDLNGSTVKLDDFDGKVLVMFFFGNGCPTCKTAGAQIQSQLADAHKSNTDFAIIGLDVWDGNSSAVTNFKNTTGIGFPLLLNASATASSYKTTYDRLVVVDKIGKIRFKGQQLASSDLANAVESVKTYLNK